MNVVESPPNVGLKFEASSRISGIGEGEMEGAVGAIDTHIDDIMGCSGPDLLPKARRIRENRLGKLTVRETSFARGHGIGPGGSPLCDVYPGGLYEEPAVAPRDPEAAGRS